VSSSKKRRDQAKSERNAFHANQRRMLAEHHLSIMQSFAEIVAHKVDATRELVNKVVPEAVRVLANSQLADPEATRALIANLEELRTLANDTKLSATQTRLNLQKPYDENLAKVEAQESGISKHSVPVSGSDESAECPLPLHIIPNYMGINLCNVKSVDWLQQNDGQLVELTINFIPETAS
jgi:hypothetical protein